MTHVDEIETSMADGWMSSTLIEWADSGADLFGDPVERSAALAIENSKALLAARGWIWSDDRRQMERRDGFYAWYRSQGTLSPPIIQWDRIENKAAEFPQRPRLRSSSSELLILPIRICDLKQSQRWDYPTTNAKGR